MNPTTARKAQDALARAIVLLTERRFLTDDADELEEIEIELPKLEQDHERLQQLIIAGDLPTLAKPTMTQMKAVSQALRELDKLAATNTTASAILAAVRAAAEVVTT
jgi:hypothetical protein